MPATNSPQLPPPPSLSARLSGALQALRRSFAAVSPYSARPGNDDAAATAKPTGLLRDVQALGFRDYGTLASFVGAAATGDPVDDNALLLERLVQLLAKLPPASRDGAQLTNAFVNQLWGQLQHPPVASLGGAFRFRAADGSGNSILRKELGAAGTPYARSVRPVLYQEPVTARPDAGLLFDKLMARRRGEATFEAHPNGISSMLFYLATVITHDIFQTDPDDVNNNLTSSYLDLSPLYGRNEGEQTAVRQLKDGLLKPDCFSSKRLLGFPPGCGVVLIMFNRFHNYVVTQLALINEGGRFTKPSPAITGDAATAAWKTYDEQLFQTGRLITCGLYANIILKDYVRTILNLNRTASTWDLDPRAQEAGGSPLLGKAAPEGVGNQVSAEFNLIYRWHAAVSERDAKWTEAEFRRVLGTDRDPAQASTREIVTALGRWEAALPSDPVARSFAGLARGPADGTLDADGLVRILRESVEDTAGSFGANRVPDCLRSVEVLGILQARAWRVATLNEFRAFFGLTRHATFADINPDPAVAAGLAALYDSPDAVELYPGIVVEKAKPAVEPGSGLCVGFTTSRAILADAVSLVRSDRFYTTDYTAAALTNWGHAEVQYDLTVDQGCMLHRLIFRAFPQHFARDSVYAHFPLVTPATNRAILTKLDSASQYSWDAPQRQAALVPVTSYRAIAAIAGDQANFKVTWGESIEMQSTTSGGVWARDFALSGDGPANAASRTAMTRCLYAPKDWEGEVRSFYRDAARLLLREHSFVISGSSSDATQGKSGSTREVDIVRDVIGLANTRFVASALALPLKTAAQPRGVYTEQELFLVMVVCFSAIFFDADVAQSFKLRATARQLTQQLGQLLLPNAEVAARGGGGLLERLFGPRAIDSNGQEPTLPSYGEHMVRRLLAGQGGKSVDEVVWGTMLPLAAAGVANQTQLMAQCVDYYLGPDGDGAAHLPELRRLARADTAEADDKLTRYLLEAARLRATVGVYRALATEQTITDYNPCVPDPSDPKGLRTQAGNMTPITTTHPAGTTLLLDFCTAGRDPAVFPEPDQVRLDRPLDAYIMYGWGPHQCLGLRASQIGLTALFKEIVGLEGLRRAPGARGVLKDLPASQWTGQIGGGVEAVEESEPWLGLRMYTTADQSAYWPLPTTMRVRWEEA